MADVLRLPKKPKKCSVAERPHDCTIVIFGASGDLSSRKLFPALARLCEAGDLPDNLAIIGAARTKMNTEEFREKVREWLNVAEDLKGLECDKFLSNIHYRPMEYGDLAGYLELARFILSIEHAHGTSGNRMFYLAIPPTLYETVSGMLGASNLSGREDKGHWTRIVVEKPFGHDLASSRQLNASMRENFFEEQIFRTDNYLAKETVQNILLLRFANALFEPVWNRTYVDQVSILATEELGVEQRAGYYEKAGVLRDMFQNHMMQLLALAAMEPPSAFKTKGVQDEKTKVYQCLRPFEPKNGFRHLVLGQYAASADGKVPGYRAEPNVAPASITPTFAKLKVYVDNWRWQGVPFFICSGKRLARKLTRIVVQLKEVPHAIYRDIVGEKATPNRLIMEIHPKEAIKLTLQAKMPGEGFCLHTATMSFDVKSGATGPPLDSYEKVFLDCMLGDHMLFWRQDEVELSWGYLNPVLEMCDQCQEKEKYLKFYPAGSWGPPEANLAKLNSTEDTDVDVQGTP